jgi:hypothetical protein
LLIPNAPGSLTDTRILSPFGISSLLNRGRIRVSEPFDQVSARPQCSPNLRFDPNSTMSSGKKGDGSVQKTRTPTTPTQTTGHPAPEHRRGPTPLHGIGPHPPLQSSRLFPVNLQTTATPPGPSTRPKQPTVASTTPDSSPRLELNPFSVPPRPLHTPEVFSEEFISLIRQDFATQLEAGQQTDPEFTASHRKIAYEECVLRSIVYNEPLLQPSQLFTSSPHLELPPSPRPPVLPVPTRQRLQAIENFPPPGISPTFGPSRLPKPSLPTLGAPTRFQTAPGISPQIRQNLPSTQGEMFPFRNLTTPPSQLPNPLTDFQQNRPPPRRSPLNFSDAGISSVFPGTYVPVTGLIPVIPRSLILQPTPPVPTPLLPSQAVSPTDPDAVERYCSGKASELSDLQSLVSSFRDSSQNMVSFLYSLFF